MQAQTPKTLSDLKGVFLGLQPPEKRDAACRGIYTAAQIGTTWDDCLFAIATKATGESRKIAGAPDVAKHLGIPVGLVCFSLWDQANQEARGIFIGELKTEHLALLAREAVAREGHAVDQMMRDAVNEVHASAGQRTFMGTARQAARRVRELVGA